MQERRGATFVLLGVFVLAGLVLAGCGRPESDLSKATDKARRLYDKACSHLKDPVFKINVPEHSVEEQYAPLTRDLDLPPDEDANAGSIVSTPPEQLNPLVEESLTLAADELQQAFDAAGEDVPDSDKVLAQAMLARIYALVGFRWALESDYSRDRAWYLLRRLEHTAIRMSDHGKRIANCDAVLNITSDEIAQMLAKATSESSDASGKISQLQGKIDLLKGRKASLVSANDKLQGEARDLRIKSQLAEAMEGIELFDQAKIKTDLVTRNTVEITKIEDQIEFLTGDIATLAISVETAKKRTAAAKQLEADRQERDTETTEKRDGFIAVLTETQKEVQTLSGEVIEVCRSASQAEMKAIAAYAKADAQYKAYSKATQIKPSSGKGALASNPVVLALFGDMRMTRGDLRFQSVVLQKRIGDVADLVARTWSALPAQKDVPPIVGKVVGYMPDVEKARQDAQDDFRWAAKEFEKAIQAVGRATDAQGRNIGKQLQWVYQLQLAAAYAKLADSISGEDEKQEARGKGMAALDALGEATASPYVAPHAERLRQLMSGGGGAPAAPTAP